MSITELEQHIKSGEKCHLVGVGGVSMSPLAEILYNMGIKVSGSDISDSEAVERLRELGIDVKVGHEPQHISDAKYIIRTAAAREDNIEIKEARKRKVPVYERAQAWGYIMRRYKHAICVAGAHGKTTTTSMIAQILLCAEVDPTIMIGGTLPVLGSGYRVGTGDTIVLESCEYYNSYHNFYPTVAVILNIDADHLDFFKDIDDLKSSFRKFAKLVPEHGFIVCNSDDANSVDALAPLERDLFKFGFGNEARLRGVNVKHEGKNPSMDIILDEKPFCKVKLQVPGLHNLKNALAASAAAISIGIPAEIVEQGLNNFYGVGRRFEYKGSINGADVYDDYAHHPNELKPMLSAARALGKYERIILAFQPHTYTRTSALFDDFVNELSQADITFLAPIYAAREQNEIGITSDMLADAIPGARSYATFTEISDEIAAIAREGDIVLTVGAGDIYKVGETLVGSLYQNRR